MKISSQSDSDRKISVDADWPDQTRVWDAFGHASGAALGCELTIRLANFDARSTKLTQSKIRPQALEAKKNKLIGSAMEGTFGQCARQFLDLYPSLVNGELERAITEAIQYRNWMFHQFLFANAGSLTSEKGLDLIATELAIARDQFERLELHIRASVPVDWDYWAEIFRQRDITLHPLWHLVEGTEE